MTRASSFASPVPADPRTIALLERIAAGLEDLREGLRSAVADLAESSNGRVHEASEPVAATDRLLNAQQVADLIGINPRTLRDRRHAGGFPAPIMIGRSPRWKRAAIDAWIAKARRA
jgi:predicted DNA-binding transcriptional regulator AlpA